MEAWPSQVRHLVLIQKTTGSNPVASSIHAAVGKLAKSLRSDRRVLRVRLPSAAPFFTMPLAPHWTGHRTVNPALKSNRVRFPGAAPKFYTFDFHLQLAQVGVHPQAQEHQRPLAQSGSAPALGAGGPRFKSEVADQHQQGARIPRGKPTG